MSEIRDDKQEALEDLFSGRPRDFVAAWLEALRASAEEERKWREDEATEANKAYKGADDSDAAEFNIFHSNIETLVPALYNSSPIPDVRRRFADDDPVAGEVSELIERAISFSIDDYDFDDTMKRVVKDMATVDRGVARIKYEPTFAPVESAPEDAAEPGEEPGGDSEGQAEDAAEPAEEPGEEVVYEEAKCCYVPWRAFRRGPARTWDEMPWIAFEHYLSRAEVTKIVMASNAKPETKATILAGIRYTHSAESKGDKADEAKELPKFGARAHVWEIWDKDTRSVVFLCEDYADFPLSVKPDPLRLRDFFPTPRPAMVIEATDSLTPITSYSIYRKLIAELNDLTARIDHLVDQIKVRGGYVAVEGVDQIASAGDGEMIPLSNAEMFATTGGDISKAIMFWPLEMIYKALEVLVQQREVVKRTIYEVTGLADIIRGATDPKETATAQQIKQQWGSIRIKSHQQEVERYARDLFDLKAEIFARHFSLQTLMMITGLQYPTKADQQRAQMMQQLGQQKIAEFQQQGGDPSQVPPEVQQQVQQAAEQLAEVMKKPAQEDIEALMRNERLRKYRVDVESDSTIRGDLGRAQEQMKGFIEGLGAYIGAVGPMVQEGVMDPKVAIEILSAFCRSFRLGKQAEAAIDEWADGVRKNGIQGKPPDPTAQAEAQLKLAQAKKTEAETGKIQTETQILPVQAKMELADRQDQRAERKARFGMDQAVARHGMQRDQAQHRLAIRQHSEGMDLQNKQHDLAERQREDSNEQGRMSMLDARAARYEGYKAEGKDVAPINPEELQMTYEERKILEKNAEVLGQVATAMQAMAQQQAQATQQLAAAIQQLAAAQAAPKRIVRDQAGRAIGTAPAGSAA